MFSPWRKVSWASQRSLSDLGGQRFGNSLRSEGAVNSINPMSRSSGLSSRAVGKFGLTLVPYVIHSAELSKSLPEIEKALSASETVLARIQVTELPVQYREGKFNRESAKSRVEVYTECPQCLAATVSRNQDI